jgi:hypothetical protein
MVLVCTRRCRDRHACLCTYIYTICIHIFLHSHVDLPDVTFFGNMLVVKKILPRCSIWTSLFKMDNIGTGCGQTMRGKTHWPPVILPYIHQNMSFQNQSSNVCIYIYLFYGKPWNAMKLLSWKNMTGRCGKDLSEKVRTPPQKTKSHRAPVRAARLKPRKIMIRGVPPMVCRFFQVECWF